jgi:hypothetical protein
MSSLENSRRPDFDRRRKNDRTVDSICLHCCATIAVSSSEAVLEAKEASHYCWQRQQKLLRELSLRAS